MEFSAAPMEGLTGFVWRQIHHKYFGGADVYYIPFVSPTKEPKFTPDKCENSARELIRVWKSFLNC